MRVSDPVARTPREEFLRADGRRLECLWTEPPADPGPAGSEPALVFLHEGLGCAALWKDFPARLAAAAGLGALAYSRAGYGTSDPAELPRPVDYMHHEGRVVLPQLLAAAGIDDAVLVGHSDGASISVVYAGTYSDGERARVRALVLMAPHVFTEPEGLRSIHAAAEEYRTTRLRERLAGYHGAQVDGAFWGWHDAWLQPGFRQWNLERFLPAVRVPVLLIQGTEDRYGTARQLDVIEAGVAGPVERLLLPDCGHAPHRDQADITFEAILRFLRRLGLG